MQPDQPSEGKPALAKVLALRRIGLVLAPGLICIGISGAFAQSQYPIMDRIAERVVQKYQSSSCQQLAAERGQRPSGQKEVMEERIIRMLHEDPQMRQAFLNRVAAPIANKLFECGIIP
ncbi:MAG: hypothetical protein JOY71_14995 [Acetobacteraceae bacterium]|nr:hypothetical protein [Acetobacteraceae bacterium]